MTVEDLLSRIAEYGGRVTWENGTLNLVRPFDPYWRKRILDDLLPLLVEHRSGLLRHFRGSTTEPVEVPPEWFAEAVEMMAHCDRLVCRLGVPGTHPALSVPLQVVAAALEAGDFDGLRFACSELCVAARGLRAEMRAPVREDES